MAIDPQCKKSNSKGISIIIVPLAEMKRMFGFVDCFTNRRTPGNQELLTIDPTLPDKQEKKFYSNRLFILLKGVMLHIILV